MLFRSKKWLKDNPDKHVWKYNDKFISKPCEFLKEMLKNKKLEFVEEYKPLLEYNYSIDIAFTKNKIGIEVNGNHHYETDINNFILKKYYQKRHDLIEKDGWTLIELHYKKVYNEEIIDNLIKNFDLK